MEFKQSDKDLYKLVISTKAKLLLEKARVVSQVEVNPEIINGSVDDVSKYLNFELFKTLTAEIQKNFSMHIQDETDIQGKVMKKIDLMVIPTDMLKEVIDEIIVSLPKSVIDEVKNKKSAM